MLLFFYIIKELLFPLFLTLGIIASILLMNQIYQFIPYLQATDLEIQIIFQMILYSLPSILMVATPISLLIGIYIGINRVSTDYELIVIRASGVSLAYLFKPVLFLATLLMGFVLVQSFYLSPMGVTELEKLKFNILKKQTKINLSVRRINNFLGQKLIYIFEKEEDLLKGVFIADWNDPQGNAIIEAKQGKIYLNETNQKIYFHLTDGKIHTRPSDTDYRIIEFKQMTYHLNPSALASKDANRTSKLSSKQRTAKKDTELALGELIELIRSATPESNELLDWKDELHSRIVTILSCLCFAIFALPIAIQDPRSPKSGSILYIIIGLIVYFYIFAQARSFLIQGKAPVIALYSPLIISIAVGLFNFHKTNHNIDSYFQVLRKRLGGSKN